MANAFPTREEIESKQLEEIGDLIWMVLPDNKFYDKKLADVDACISSLPEFLARIPFTTKQELIDDQAANPPFGTNHTYPIGDYSRFVQTSGTTREPLRWLDRREDWEWMVSTWKTIYEAAGVTQRDRVYFAFSFGPFIGFWLAYDAAQSIGCLGIPGGGLSSPARLRAMRDNGATVLCCTPSYAIRLGEVAHEEKISTATLKTIIVAGEAGGSIPATRKRIEQLWPGVRVFDHHGMTETGPVTFECPVQPGILHIVESAYFAEIVDKNGNHVKAGEAGELILTPLGRIGSPLLRYKTGDLVKAQPQQRCKCGRYDLALAGGILGRIDDMVVVRGVNVYPTAFEDLLRGFPEVAEYQVEIDKTKALAEVRLKIEPTSGANESQLAEQLQTAIQDTFHLRAPVAIAPAGTLPRFEMKAKRWKVLS